MLFAPVYRKLLVGLLTFGPCLLAQNRVSEADALAALARCAQCHGPTLQMSKLNLSTRGGMLKGGEKGPSLIPGNAEASPIYRRISGLQKPAMPMAPVPALTSKEVELVRNWIDQGAQWPASSAPASVSPAPALSSQVYPGGYRPRVITEQDRQWWAFQQPVRRQPPKVTDARWSRNPIDGFVRGMLDKKGLEPAPEADRRTLIRRAYLDLTGLLPPPETVEAFVKDPAPDAYEKLIDRLLASPNYGERWGRFWLDVVRYADSSGFEFDINVDNAWRYRDYVIKAFNEDKPYDRFLVEQIAGDEMDHPTNDSLTATTYYRIGPRVRFREKNYPNYRFDYMDDMVRTTFQGFMGLSVNCARCHDHKFDPITRLDYYKSVAAFWSYVDYDQPLVPTAQVEAYNAKLKQLAAEMTPLQQEIVRIEKPYRDKQREELVAQALKKFPADIQQAIKTPEAQRTPGQRLLVAQVIINPEEADPDNLVVDANASAKARAAAKANQVFGVADEGKKLIKVNEADEKRRAQLLARIKEIEDRLPQPLPVADGVRDGDYRLAPDGLGDSHIPGTGRPDYGLTCCFIPAAGQKYAVPPVFFAAKGEDLKREASTFEVEPGFLTVLSGANPPPATHPPNRPDYVSSGRRRALAEAITSPTNPLTSRVMANRIWGWHFGTGIVATPGNFGKMGTLPSNPELLDWLATEFVQQGWSVKRLQKLIMTSETYKMASAFSRETNRKIDPTNVYQWRFPPRRLEAEIIRDATLFASGQLNKKMGGEPFFPAIPASLRADQPRGNWDLTKEEPATWRRSVYAYVKRGLKYPMFEVFDEPDLNVTCERRAVSTVPTQALTLLNNEFTLIQADYFAGRVWKTAGMDAAKQIDTMYRIAFSRPPSESEMRTNLAFLQKQAAGSTARAALTDLAHVVLNLNEFVYLM
jgi:mono/diheme cytochrome c family protein